MAFAQTTAYQEFVIINTPFWWQPKHKRALKLTWYLLYLLSGGHMICKSVQSSLLTLNHSKQHCLALWASLHSPAEQSGLLGGCQDRVFWQYWRSPSKSLQMTTVQKSQLQAKELMSVYNIERDWNCYSWIMYNTWSVQLQSTTKRYPMHLSTDDLMHT